MAAWLRQFSQAKGRQNAWCRVRIVPEEQRNSKADWPSEGWKSTAGQPPQVPAQGFTVSSLSGEFFVCASPVPPALALQAPRCAR